MVVIVLSSIGSICTIIASLWFMANLWLLLVLFWIPWFALDVYIWKILQSEYLNIKDIENQRPKEVELGNENGPVSKNTSQHQTAPNHMSNGKENNHQNSVLKNGVLEKWRNGEIFSPGEQDNIQNEIQSPPPYSRFAWAKHHFWQFNDIINSIRLKWQGLDGNKCKVKLKVLWKHPHQELQNKPQLDIAAPLLQNTFWPH